jgi:hypothetical protein
VGTFRAAVGAWAVHWSAPVKYHDALPLSICYRERVLNDSTAAGRGAGWGLQGGCCFWDSGQLTGTVQHRLRRKEKESAAQAVGAVAVDLRVCRRPSGQNHSFS